MIRNVCASCERVGADIRRRSQCNAHHPSLVFCFACIPDRCRQTHRDYLQTPPDYVIARHLLYGALNLVLWITLTVAFIEKHVQSVVLLSGVTIVTALLTIRAYQENEQASGKTKVVS